MRLAPQATHYKGQWHPSTYPPIIDRITWDRVQALLGEKVYKAHELRDRDAAVVKIDWQFATDDARVKLKSLYPTVHLQRSTR